MTRRIVFGLFGCALAMWPAALFAQSQPATTQTTAASAQSSWRTQVSSGDLLDNEFVISGFVGRTHSGDTDSTSMGYAASFDYLKGGMFGFEFLSAFSPNLDLQGAVTDDTQVNNYMFNAIGAIPIGSEGGFQPYVSGGIGALTMRSQVSSDLADVFHGPDETDFAGNIGFGAMAFANWIGIRADMRYFTALGNNNTTNPVIFQPTDDHLSFWRSTVGLSFRW